MQVNKLVDDVQNQIIKLVNSEIEEGKVEVDSYYFKEGDFVEKLNVSRSTVREAVRSLEVRGYLERVHGKGVQAVNKSVEVATNSLNDMLIRNGSNFKNIIEFRKIIEVQGTGIAAKKRTEEQIEQMEKYVEIMQDVNVPYQEYLDADFSFHCIIMEATDNDVLIAIVNSYRHIIKEAILVSTDTEYRPEHEEHYHENIMNCIVDKDEKGAIKAMEKHLSGTEQNMIKLHKIETINW